MPKIKVHGGIVMLMSLLAVLLGIDNKQMTYEGSIFIEHQTQCTTPCLLSTHGTISHTVQAFAQTRTPQLGTSDWECLIEGILCGQFIAILHALIGMIIFIACHSSHFRRWRI